MPHHRQAAWKAHGRITRRHWRHVLHRVARWTRGRKTWPEGKIQGRNDHTQRCKWLSQSCGTLFQCSSQRLVLCHPAVLLNIEHVALLKPDMGLARSEHDHKVDEGWRLETKKIQKLFWWPPLMIGAKHVTLCHSWRWKLLLVISNPSPYIEVITGSSQLIAWSNQKGSETNI